MTRQLTFRRALIGITAATVLVATLAEAGPLRDAKRALGLGGGRGAANQEQAAGGGRRGNIPGVQSRAVNIDGVQRTYHFYVPNGAGSGSPMVMALHGGGGNALQFAQRVNLRGMADTYGFVVVIPEGAGRGRSGGSWNADSVVRQGYAETQRVNDVGFLTAVIDGMRSEVGVNPARVYVMGLSKGGMMAYRLACAVPERVAAIAAVASVMSTDRCAGGADVSVLHIHGTEDENVPLAGGRGRLTGGNASYPPVQTGIETFAAANSCSAAQQSQVASDTVCAVRSCAGADAVTLCTVAGGGHAWPGTQPARWQRRENVYVSQNFDATRYIAEFFLSH